MISQKLKEQLGTWECLYPFFESPEWPIIKDSIRPDIEKITPEVDVWFRCFRETPYQDLTVVWLGMSPYFTVDNYTKDRVADGLAFSTKTKHSVPPSLFELYKGLEWDLWDGMNLNMERTNDLTFLANQGVLLLNSALTTPLGDSKAHIPIWEPFIKFVIDVLNKEKNRLVFAGFGAYANTLLRRVDRAKHFVEEREHPAACTYRGEHWKHDKLFSRIDELTQKYHNKTIAWDKYLIGLEPAPF